MSIQTILLSSNKSINNTIWRNSIKMNLIKRTFASLNKSNGKQNIIEKIAQKYAVGVPDEKFVHAGDFITIKPGHCMSHDNSWPVAMKFTGLGGKKIRDNKQIVMTLDHDVQNKSETNLKKYSNIQQFAKNQGVDFYPAGRGIGHQVMIEEGYAFPLTMTVASDSHSNMYGGIGALGTPIVRTDAAAIWATSQTWWQIPPVAKVELKGQLRKGVTGKDIIVALCGVFNNDEVLNHAIEFVGDALPTLPVDYRLTISNMTTEWGALSGVFPVDETLINWYKEKISSGAVPKNHPRINSKTINDLEIDSQSVKSDNDAKYAKHLILDLDTLTPYVSGPNSVKIATPLAKLSADNIKINKAYLVSCTNARLSDLVAAANIVKGHKVAPGVEFYVAPASSVVKSNAEAVGAWQTLVDEAGAIPLPAGCGPCIGLGMGLLKPGEVGISATNRNFKGRMGSKDALAYLASPEVVAASAVLGKIASPEELSTFKSNSKITPPMEPKIDIQKQENHDENTDVATTSTGDILEGFPSKISGELVFCDADNINTDGIYPGKYTYVDDVSREKMAQVCMENYDPEFGNKTKAGDILVSGFNFGTGSSREQAATAILARNIPLVVSGSFGNIFFRNSINNALLTLEVPKLISLLREKYKSESKPELTRRTGWYATWDVATSTFTVTDGKNGKVILSQKVGELGKNLQEIIVSGGLEQWVKNEISA